ncbi:MAG: ATP-binding protein [Lachnospiraceae bacterium]
MFAIMSAYLCCQISKWFGIVALTISKKQWFLYLICIAVLIPTWYFIVKYASSSMMLILATSSKTILIFCILPISYYIFDYTTNVYSKLLYSGSPIIFEFLPFILCIAYLAFNILYFKEYEEKRTAKQETQLMELKQTESIKEIEEIRRSAYEISLVRHDMRHFLNNVLFYIESDNTEKATSYIKEVIHATDHTAITKFCDNELVNMILCSYHSKIIKQNITFHATVQISHTLPCSDIDFTSILANALENSIQAVLNLKPEQRTITLDIHMKDTKLLLSLQNPYTKKPEMEYGRPITHESGHGFGTQSIKYVTNKLNGNCQFVAKDGVFTLRIIL